jgi:hypothetical protein
MGEYFAQRSTLRAKRNTSRNAQQLRAMREHFAQRATVRAMCNTSLNAQNFAQHLLKAESMKNHNDCHPPSLKRRI